MDDVQYTMQQMYSIIVLSLAINVVPGTIYMIYLWRKDRSGSFAGKLRAYRPMEKKTIQDREVAA